MLKLILVNYEKIKKSLQNKIFFVEKIVIINTNIVINCYIEKMCNCQKKNVVIPTAT